MKIPHLKLSGLMLLLLFTLSSCSKEETVFESIKGKVVAELKDDSPVIIVDKENLLIRFQELAKSDDIIVDYNRLDIREMENGTYAMFAFSEDNVTKSATTLSLSNNKLIVSNSLGGSITCVTQGFSTSTGYTPYQKAVITHEGSGIIWTCSEYSSDCRKTMSVNL